MHRSGRTLIVVASFISVVAVAGCAEKDDAQVCASQGAAQGTPGYDQCVSKLAQRRAELAAEDKDRSQLAKAAGSLSGRWHNGCSQSPVGKVSCDDGN